MTNTNAFMERMQQIQNTAAAARKANNAPAFTLTERLQQLQNAAATQQTKNNAPTFSTVAIQEDGTITMTAIDDEFGRYFAEMNKHCIGYDIISMHVLYMNNRTHSGAKWRIQNAMGLFNDNPTTDRWGRKHDRSRQHKKFRDEYLKAISSKRYAERMLSSAEADLRHARNDGERAYSAWECIFWKWILCSGDAAPNLEILDEARSNKILASDPDWRR